MNLMTSFAGDATLSASASIPAVGASPVQVAGVQSTGSSILLNNDDFSAFIQAQLQLARGAGAEDASTVILPTIAVTPVEGATLAPVILTVNGKPLPAQGEELPVELPSLPLLMGAVPPHVVNAVGAWHGEADGRDTLGIAIDNADDVTGDVTDKAALLPIPMAETGLPSVARQSTEHSGTVALNTLTAPTQRALETAVTAVPMAAPASASQSVDHSVEPALPVEGVKSLLDVAMTQVSRNAEGMVKLGDSDKALSGGEQGKSAIAAAVTGSQSAHAFSGRETGLPVATPVDALQSPIEPGKPGFSEAIGQRIMWLSAQQATRANIDVDPPELGPLQVRISHQHDQTSIMFTSPHAQVRDALDQGLARLREILEGQGLNLANLDVSDQGAQRQQQQADGYAQQYADGSDDGDTAVAGDAVATRVDGVLTDAVARPLGMVDYYA